MNAAHAASSAERTFSNMSSCEPVCMPIIDCTVCSIGPSRPESAENLVSAFSSVDGKDRKRRVCPV